MARKPNQNIQSAFDAVGKHARSRKVGGRPKKTVDPQVVFGMASQGLTINEMADVVGISLATMNRRLKEPEIRRAYTQGRCNVKIALRHSQLKLAHAGNTTMLIWLGKQYLGQKNEHTVQLSAEDELPQMEGPRMVHIPWTEDLEREWNAIDAEFPELDGVV